MDRLGETASVRESGDFVHWQDFSVRFQFGVHFTRGLFDPENWTLVDTLTRLEPDRRHRCMVYYDDGLTAAFPDLVTQVEAYAAAHAERMELIVAPLPVVGGEKIKSDLHYVESIQQQLYDHHVDRHSYVIAIGGGAVLDAIGLIAATTHRGIRHIRVPTTVLSQNDSGVGVKNGVNLFGSKNFVGTFAPPFAVLNDYDFIERLPQRDKIAGMAEAVKVALIRDGAFFEWLERHADDLAVFEESAMRYMIRRCRSTTGIGPPTSSNP
jgi:3-dehydroquinate synthase